MLQREQVGRNAIRRVWAWPHAFVFGSAAFIRFGCANVQLYKHRIIGDTGIMEKKVNTTIVY